jgi:hypothetical protein
MLLELRIRLPDNLYTVDLGLLLGGQEQKLFTAINTTQQQFAALSGTRATARLLV